MKFRLLYLCCVTACQPTPPAAPRPAGPPPPQAACAPAIPLLAKQHTPNVTRLYLAPLTLGDATIQIGAPAVATSKQGYVSQPLFAPDGAGLYFTWRPEGSQADIWFHDLGSGAERPVTCTSVEEYSARLIGDGLTVIRVAPDLTRELVSLGLDGRERQVLFPGMTTIGAYNWIDATTAALFVPPTPPASATSLVLGDLRTGKLETVAENVGPALSMIPGTHDLSYIDQSNEDHWNLMRLDVGTHAATLVLPLPDGVTQVTWLPDGSMLACIGTRIVRASIGAPAWRDVVDLAGSIDGTLSGMVISKDQRRIALVTSIPPR